MRFGLSLSGISPRHYASLAQEAEELGFESVWVPDHLVLPETLPQTYLYADDGKAPIDAATAVYDPWVLLGGIATATERIRLGTNVYVLPLRHPVVVARAVLTVDRLSRGRVTLGAGVGWLVDEYRIVGENPTTRGRRADEVIPLLRRLWTEEVVEHHGEFYDLPAVRFEPKPFQRPIPIEVGGSSPQALRRAGTLGDGWIEIGSADLGELEQRVRQVEQVREETGRGDLPFAYTGGVAASDGTEHIDRMAAIGFDRLVLKLRPRWDRSEMSAMLTRFARVHLGRS